MVFNSYYGCKIAITLHCYIQWNLQTMDTLGTSVLYIIRRLSPLWRVHYRRFHCIHTYMYVYTIYTDPITSQVMLRDLWDPPLNIENTSKRNTNSVGSRAWDSVVDGFESLVSLAEQAWLTPAQLISVVILTWTWMYTGELRMAVTA